MMPNSLYYGDNLDILRRYVRDESVDLVYLDPPFGWELGSRVCQVVAAPQWGLYRIVTKAPKTA